MAFNGNIWKPWEAPWQAVGPYVPDFVLPLKIAVEVDGYTHFYAFSQRLTVLCRDLMRCLMISCHIFPYLAIFSCSPLDFPHVWGKLPALNLFFSEAKSELKRRILRALGWGARFIRWSLWKSWSHGSHEMSPLVMTNIANWKITMNIVVFFFFKQLFLWPFFRSYVKSPEGIWCIYIYILHI